MNQIQHSRRPYTGHIYDLPHSKYTADKLKTLIAQRTGVVVFNVKLRRELNYAFIHAEISLENREEFLAVMRAFRYF